MTGFRKYTLSPLIWTLLFRVREIWRREKRSGSRCSDPESRLLIPRVRPRPCGEPRTSVAWSLRAANEVSRVIPEAMVLGCARSRAARRELRGRACSREGERRIAEGSMRFGEMYPQTTPWVRSLSPSLATLVSSVCVASPLFGGPSRPRPRLSLPLRRFSLRAASPMPRVRRDEGETGVVLLIAHNHAFHPRTPRPRPRRPFLSSTRKLVRCTLDGCTASRLTPPHPSPDAVMKFTPWRKSGTLLHRRLLRIWYARRSRLDLRDVNSQLVFRYSLMWNFQGLEGKKIWSVWKKNAAIGRTTKRKGTRSVIFLRHFTLSNETLW